MAALISVAAVAATIAIPTAHTRPYFLSAAAVALTAWACGVGPALLTTAITAAGTTLFLMLGHPEWGIVEAVQAAIYIGVGLVITFFAKRQRTSDREARRQGGHLEAMFGQASLGLAIAGLDGRLKRVNPRLAAILQRPQAVVESLTWRELTHPDDRPCGESLIGQLTTGSLKEFNVEQRCLLPNGATVWVHASVARLLDADGHPEGLIAIVEDVSERHEAEHRVRASENRYRSLVDASMAIVWTADPRGRFVPPQESWEASTGQKADQYADSGWTMAIHQDDRARVERQWRETIADPRPMETELRLWTAASSGYRWYSARVVPAREASGAVVEWVGACTDIHERHLTELQLLEREEALKRADREKDDFLALLAHELRNPLAPIRTAVQLLKMRSQAAPDQQRLHTVIDRQLQHMVRMVDDLLDVSRVLRGKVELRPEITNVADVVATALETARPLLDAQHQQLRTELPERPIAIWGDGMRLSQVISNLLNNASKYSDTGATVTLTVHQNTDDVVIRVTDAGAGIPPELLPRIFEPFVQADRSLERTRGGLGIGLTLVRRIVELHGGRVSASSRGPGLGSQFEVHLPALKGPAAVAEAAGTAAPASPSVVPPARVLVVDDNVDAAESLALLLRDGGHTVQIAHNGIDALRDAAAWPPDVVILDIGLPGMSGYEVATLLHARGGDGPALIAVTGYGQFADTSRAFAAGFQHHLVKPVDAADLQTTIAECLRARRAGT